MVTRLSIVLLAMVASVVFLPPARPAPAATSRPVSAAASSPTPSLAAAAPGTATAAAGPRWSNRSYYVGNPSAEAMRNLGCGQGDVQGRMSLFFGAPVVTGSGVGATLWGGADRSTPEIAELMKEFVRGYVVCRRSPSHQLLVGMGTSTSAIGNKADAWLTLHGRHWADHVGAVDVWAQQHHPGVVGVYGAWDPEPSWSSPHKAETWMRGYASAPAARGLHVHASADGCPRDTSDNGACSNGWRQHDLWRLAWQYDPALPLPQIYAISGVNARQWQRIDEYGARHHGDGLVFYGVMSQQGACLQVGGCRGTDNSPAQAHDHLLLHLNAHPATAQPEIETATDVQWHR